MITEVDLSGTPCFAPGATLKDLKKVNFIFGPNGTGKTSITRILGEGLNDARIKHSTDDSSNREILILNSKYIEETFKETENGIFFLGKQSITNENEIQEHKRRKEKLTGLIESLQSDKDKLDKDQSDAERELLDSVWNTKKLVPDQLSSCLDGFHKRKQKLLDKVTEYRQKPLPSEGTLPTTLDELAQQEKGLLTTTLETVPQISAIPQFPRQLEDLPDLLHTPLIPAADSPLSDLISQIQHSDWVREGKHIMEAHQDALDDRCPFCQQQTPQDFSEDLAKLWDRSYDDAVTQLRSRLTSLESSLEQLSTFKHKIGSHQLEDVAEYSRNAQLDAIEKALSKSHTLLEKKLDKQSQSFDAPEEWDIDSFNSTLRQLGEQLNALIGEHNAKVNDQDNLQKEFRNKFWIVFSHHTCNTPFADYESIVGGNDGTLAKITTIKGLFIVECGWRRLGLLR